MTKAIARKKSASPAAGDYSGFVGSIDAARRASVRTVNTSMTATYWEIGRRIVEFEQGGLDRAKYGESVVDRLAQDLSSRLGRGFSRRNVFLMRAFFLALPRPVLNSAISTSPGAKVQTASALSCTDAALPDEKTLADELEKTRKQLEVRK